MRHQQHIPSLWPDSSSSSSQPTSSNNSSSSRFSSSHSRSSSKSRSSQQLLSSHLSLMASTGCCRWTCLPWTRPCTCQNHTCQCGTTCLACKPLMTCTGSWACRLTWVQQQQKQQQQAVHSQMLRTP